VIGWVVGKRDHTTPMRSVKGYCRETLLSRLGLDEEPVLSLGDVPEGIEIPGEDEWADALKALRATPLPKRPAAWRSQCRALFPVTWQAQAARPPRGVAWPAL
jgi:hypothetical protein